ncbi:MAG: CoA pyrophosphatase [Bacteroidota bacterium]|nr:CoA pyrophosphatase [Bacteroidota bacterium]
MFENYINLLYKELKKELPGIKAQNKMAPIKHLNNTKFSKRKINAAILLLLYPKDNNIYTILIKRPIYNGDHSGQISFPGGKYEHFDNNFKQTALRETYEEIGVPSSKINILGSLTQLSIPVNNYKIYPFVGYSNKKPIFTPNHEVEKILEIDISTLSEKNIQLINNTSSNGFNFKAPTYKINNYDIWGATAMILSEFSEINYNISILQ